MRVYPPSTSRDRMTAALVRVVEESKRLASAVEALADEEEVYTTHWASLVSGGKVQGANETERRASEAALLTMERQGRDGARMRVRQCEIWREVALQQLNVYTLIYETEKEAYK